MSIIYTLSLCCRLTLDLHDLNNEGTEGNQQMTRMVWIVVKDPDGKPTLRNVNAISGDMFKHIQAEHLHKIALLHHADDPKGFPVSRGALLFDANRINSAEDKAKDGFWWLMEQEVERRIEGELKKRQGELKDIKDAKEKKKKEKEIRRELIKTGGFSKSNSQILDEMLKACVVTDLEGTLVTAEVTGENRSLARKSCIEFGWVVGLPDLTRSDSLFHVKYDPRERGEASGEETLRQAIFYRPVNSGVYAFVSHVELYRVGRNDITLEHVVEQKGREVRVKALLESLWYTFVKTSGAQRNTQHPHLLGMDGAIAYSANLSVPSPTASPLEEDFLSQLEGSKNALNKLHPNAISVKPFKDQKDFGDVMADLIQSIQVCPDAEK